VTSLKNLAASLAKSAAPRTASYRLSPPAATLKNVADLLAKAAAAPRTAKHQLSPQAASLKVSAPFFLKNKLLP
jgi:hypothetical protein